MILGERSYLRVVSMMFLCLHRSGVLRLFRKFQTHYLAGLLINKNDIIIDIGANLGYYSSIFAERTGPGGKVFCVEPVPLYRDILISNTAKFRNIEILPYALGDKEGNATMGIPVDQKFRHGLTRIIEKENDKDTGTIFNVEIKTPSGLFGELNSLDYIKCDVEGYEDKIIPGFETIISRFKPTIQIESDKSNFDYIDSFLNKSGYSGYIVSGRRLKPLMNRSCPDSDIIYVPENKIDKIIT